MAETDLISRQAAIREYQEVCKGIKCGECPLLIKVNTEKGSHLITDCKLEAFLHDLPSAQPERKTGRWVSVTNGRGGHECDLCHNYAPAWQTGEERLTDFCPNCGAYMREG